MQIAPREYKKTFEYSYAFGVFATLELLQTRPHEVIRVFLNKQGMQKGVKEIEALCRKHTISTEWADGLIVKISHSENCYALGVFKKYTAPLQKDNHVVLVNPSDMGNMGTIIRTMLGFGFKDLAIIKPAADLFDPKVIRSTTGAFFKINFEFFNDFEEYMRTHTNRKIYTLMLKGAKDLATVKFTQPFSVVFGNEGTGLPEKFSQYGESIKISHSSEIESLNLSMAAGITLFTAHQQLNKK
ncbi:MAG TPA: TrmH family RNA methyltransferase [Candidatus Paceibacterota bacterium]